MRRWTYILRYAVYLVILSSLFVPLSHASWVQFVEECLARLAIIAVLVGVTSHLVSMDPVEVYRITLPPQTTARENVPTVEQRESPTKPSLLLRRKWRKSRVVFWIAVLAIYLVTRTSWWSHQAWVGRLTETAIRWGIALLCWGFLVLLWMPKADANRPELLHVVPSRGSETDAPSVSKSAH